MGNGEKRPVSRRSVLGGAVLAGSCAGVCALAVPFIGSLRGTRDAAFDAPETDDFDLATVAPGTQKVVQWRGMPVFIIHREPATLKELQEGTLRARLRDPDSRILQQPSDAVNWHRSLVPAYGIYIGICTHLGCVPTLENGREAQARYVCPCHGSHFDAAGRAYADAPAPYNLPVPPATLLDGGHVRIGVSKADPRFSLSVIQQI